MPSASDKMKHKIDNVHVCTCSHMG